jgi:hypothetical protein
MDRFESMAASVCYEPTAVAGRIGYPGDRQVRHATGNVEFRLELVVSGTAYRFEGEEAAAIALILATEIPL